VIFFKEQSKVKNTMLNGMGKVRISDEAVAEIAAVAAQKVNGVATMGSGSRMDLLVDLLGSSGGGQGVQVEMRHQEIRLKLYIVLEFGVEITEVALQVQESVAQAVEKMTGFQVLEVDVNIQGVKGSGFERK
jgi:uncharacterized alkaline shock family protein YloU